MGKDSAAVDKMVLEIADRLKSEVVRGYTLRPIPCELDEEITNLIEVFMEATPLVRKTITSQLTKEHTYALLAFSERMAARAVREKSRAPLLKGLIALGVDDGKLDLRENILILALHYHSALKVGIDPKSLFREAAVYAGDTLMQTILSFPDRSEIDKSLEAMGYVESVSPDGFRYLRTW